MNSQHQKTNRTERRLGAHWIERLENREVFSANPLPATFAPPNLTVSATEYQDSRILVRFQSNPDLATTPVHGTRLGQKISTVPDLFAVDLEAGTSVSAALAAYRMDSRVLYAEPDARVSVNLLSNDPGLSSLWGLNNTGQSGGTLDADIDAVEAWDVNNPGSSMVVAVIDSGIDYNHPDLRTNIWVNAGELAGNGVDDDRNGYVDDVHGWDFANDDNSPLDDAGHGTHVAGTIGAVRNNGIGIAGVADNVRLMALKFLGADGGGYLSDAISAIDYAWQNGARIANNSWGGGGYSQALADAIERFRQAGGIFVAAAGNEGTNNDVLPSYPANFSHDNVVSVAASDRFDRLASFSNYGAANVDVVAPGVSILSTTPNGSYSSYSGTSMATPHVSGALAEIWGQNPSWTYRQVIAQMLESTDSILTDKVAAGRLNLGNAFSTVPRDTTGPQILKADWLGNSASSLNRVRVTFNEGVNASSLTAADVSLRKPNGSLVVISGVTKVSDTVFDITFSGQTFAGVYNLTVGPNVQDLAGNLMNQDGDSLVGEAIQDQFKNSFGLNQSQTFTWSGSAAIRDYMTTMIPLNVTADLVVADLNVKVSISHTYDSDVRIYLVDPSGASRQLFNRRGGSGDGIYATFDDEVSNHISYGRAPFTGSYRPEYALSAFDGKRALGTWYLRVEDSASGDTGTVHSVSLIVQSGVTVASQTLSAVAKTYSLAMGLQLPTVTGESASSSPVSELSPADSERREGLRWNDYRTALANVLADFDRSQTVSRRESMFDWESSSADRTRANALDDFFAFLGS